MEDSSVNLPRTKKELAMRENHQESLLFHSQMADVRKMIYKLLSYEELSRLRQVCRQFNKEASFCLTGGFNNFQKELSKERSTLKKELPRRESDRRGHQLFHYSEVIGSLETRKDLLDMTYRRLIDKNLICFIPGKILDEGYRVLKFLRSRKYSFRQCDNSLLKDFRDLSSMAIEHFDEVVTPTIKETPAQYLQGFGMNESEASNQKYGNILSVSIDASNSSAIVNLQQQAVEQLAIIKNQNRTINALHTTVGVLIDAVDSLANNQQLPVTIDNLRCLWRNGKSESSISAEQQCSSKSEPRRVYKRKFTDCDVLRETIKR